MRIALRPATTGDDDFCYRLHRAAMREYVARVWGWDEAAQLGYHRRGFDPARTRIVTVDGRDAGALIVERGPDAIYLARVEIHPEWQGRGVGGRLLRDLLAEGAAGNRPVILEVLAVNDRARALYRRLGFREVGRLGENGIKIRMRVDPPTCEAARRE
jgi:ribosomal protein S18 acetylase RimI-like enzyme